jgi:beta-N-acetylhexosaminidase
LIKRKAIIFGLKGTTLSKGEKHLLKHSKPWGVIIFSRNIDNLYQLKKLTLQIRNLLNDTNYPILIDEEGGTVTRLNKLIDFKSFSQEFIGKKYKQKKNDFNKIYESYINLVSNFLSEAGININTSPVLDIKNSISDKIIGTRAFSKHTNIISKLGNLCINFYNKNKIGTVIKHIPGHGRSNNDSHFFTPIIKTSKKELIKKDFKAFKNNKSFFAMTGHLIFTSYDNKNTSTHSKTIIKNVIRKHIGFKGILISDDISMKALKYSIETNASKALNAGCNLVLHCNGKINEMKKLVKVIPNIDNFTQKKTSAFYNFLG